MDINFNIDFNEGTIYILMDNHKSIQVFKDDEGVYDFSELKKIEDDYLRAKTKDIAKILFSLEEI